MRLSAFHDPHKMSNNLNLASTARPVTDATLTVRIIKSFKYRTEKSLVLHHVDLTQTTVKELKDVAKRGVSRFYLCEAFCVFTRLLTVVSTLPSWKPYRNVILGDWPSDFLRSSSEPM